MEISVGFMMFCGGIAGAVVCFGLLALTGVVFPKKQKELLERLQSS